ncbi:MAG: hypothetical protein HWN65_10175 [Candidatus Helarchaeota archaeon]|nr:hypothetical protein [Candidatus Helarchaeota archaeon]
MEDKNESLKERILKEMTVDYSNALEKNFEIAKQMVQITKEGKINVLKKESLTVREQIQAYLIGKLYAKVAGLTDNEFVGNKEFEDELGLPGGSLRPQLKNLRDSNQISQKKSGNNVLHFMPLNLVERTLNDLKVKLK